MTILKFDPELQPVERLAGEPSLGPERLTADALRYQFRRPPAWKPEQCADIQYASDGALTPAAVLMPIVLRDEGLALVLTQRTAHLSEHAGQVSLPGGRSEPEDVSAIATALRESEEEIGLARRHVEVLGTLPDYVTATGFLVTPVVGLVHPPITLTADPFEVAEIFEVPLGFLMNGMNHQHRSVELPGGAGRRSFYAMPYEQYFIWGATAAMLRNLFQFLRA